jgi:LPS export ABC transporter protein LptC
LGWIDQQAVLMATKTRKLKMALLLTVGISIIAVVWIVYQFRHNAAGPTIPLPSETAKTAIMALSRVHQTATKDGAVQWELEAAAAELETGTGKMVLQSPKVVFFLDDGTRVNLTSREGILYTRNNNIQVRGNVQLKNSRYTLVTDVLAYEHDQRLLKSDAPVTIIGRDIELNAATMRYDLNTNQACFLGRVEGILFENPAS